MDCSIFSSLTKLLFFRASLLSILFFFMCLNIVLGTATEFGYGRHYDPVVPESKAVDEEFKISPFPGRQNGYYSGSNNILNRSLDQFYYPPASKGDSPCL
ncbi:hypothetical protein HRI_004687900 [Hibiscus trionum]|uniref:Uncharacterized protein n=1 Tax=Hibiscus trionum TaxID=183268 RepID=A0A9W7JBL4_HIBTR|nr:hypothetical protein HRI_004687900 [Hibiscus trionum]